MKLTATVLITVFLQAVCSCNSAKNKSHHFIDKAKKEIAEKKDAAIDRIIPRFDSYSPDTKFNKLRFEEFFGFAPTADVTDIYCFDDRMGIDSKFLFSFKCDRATKDRIVSRLSLSKAEMPDNISCGLWVHFPWWDSATIVTIPPYWRKDHHDYYRYLWFDEMRLRAYYIDYDL